MWRLTFVLPWLAPLGLGLVFAAWFGWLALERHAAFLTGAEDLGFTDQIVWNGLRGRPFAFTLYEQAAFTVDVDLGAIRHPDSLLAFHVEPLLLLVSPLYLVWSDPRALMFAQALALGLGALPAFALGRRVLGGGAGLMVAAVYLLSPPLHWAALSDFHTVALAAPLLVWMAAAAQAQRWTWFSVAALLATATKEEVGLAVGFLAAYTAWRWRLGRVPLAVAALAIGWTLLCFLAILPAFTGADSSPFLARYRALGDAPADMLRNLALDPGRAWGQLTREWALQHLQLLTLWSGALPLLNPLPAIAALPSLLANLLSASPWMESGRAHYGAVVIGPLLVASAAGAERLAAWCRRISALASSAGPISVAPALAGAALVAWQASPLPLAPALALPRAGPHEALAQRFLDQIPAVARVSASSSLVPHLSQRSSIYLFPTVRDADLVLVDVTGSAAPTSVGDARLRLLDLLQDGSFGVRDAADGYLLLERGRQGSSLPASFFSFAQIVALEPAEGWQLGEWRHSGGPTLLGARLWRPGTVGVRGPLWELELAWRAETRRRDQQRVLVHAFAGDSHIWSGTHESPTAWWYPPQRWKPGEIVRLRYSALPPDTSSVRVWLLPPGEGWDPSSAVSGMNGAGGVEFAAPR